MNSINPSLIKGHQGDVIMNIVRAAGKSFGQNDDFSIRVGTDHPNSGVWQGEKTILDFKHCENIEMKVCTNGQQSELVHSLRIEAQGECECDKLIEALQFSVDTLQMKRKLNPLICGQEAFK